MTDPTPDRSLEDLMHRYADLGRHSVDARAVAEAVIATGGRRGRSALVHRWAVPPLMQPALTILATVVVGATLIAGATLLTPRPPEDPAIVGASPWNGAQAPCAPMVQLGLAPDAGRGFHVAAPTGPTGNGDLLVGGSRIARFDPSVDPIEPVPTDEARRAFQTVARMAIPAGGHLVASADGIALAIEEGDLGLAGRGDPIVLVAGGGTRRPFPVGPYTAVTDLAWSPDHAALYGICRPTLDPAGQPYEDEFSGATNIGPGTVLRWDSATGAVADLGSPCGACGPLYVSPDGRRLAVAAGAEIAIMEPDGAWRTIAPHVGGSGIGRPLGQGLLGWAGADSLVWNDPSFSGGARLGLDGTVLDHWDQPCCQGTGFPAVLSPDGTMIAGLNWAEFSDAGPGNVHVMVVDVRSGASREIWRAPASGCQTGIDAGCDWQSAEAGSAAPDPVSGGSIVAWAPDGSAVVLLEQTQALGTPLSYLGRVRIVRVDGSGATHALPVDLVPPGSIAWLPG